MEQSQKEPEQKVQVQDLQIDDSVLGQVVQESEKLYRDTHSFGKMLGV